MSHQIFFALSTQPVLISSFRKSSYSERLSKASGVPVRGKSLEDFKPIAFQSGVASDPEGGIGRERVEMGQKIAGLIHDMNRHFAIGNADVDMEPEDEIGARDLLQVFHDRRRIVRPR